MILALITILQAASYSGVLSRGSIHPCPIPIQVFIPIPIYNPNHYSILNPSPSPIRVPSTGEPDKISQLTDHFTTTIANTPKSLTTTNELTKPATTATLSTARSTPKPSTEITSGLTTGTPAVPSTAQSTSTLSTAVSQTNLSTVDSTSVLPTSEKPTEPSAAHSTTTATTIQLTTTIAQTTTAASTASTTATSSDCNPVWNKSAEIGSTGEFTICKNERNLNWMDAEKVCVSYGGHLATFHSAQELELTLSKWHTELTLASDCLFVGYKRHETVDFKQLENFVDVNNPATPIDKTLLGWNPRDNAAPEQLCSRLYAPSTPDPSKALPLPMPLLDDIWCTVHPATGAFISQICHFACKRP